MKEDKKEFPVDSNENIKENPKSFQDSKLNNEIKNKKNIFDISKFEQKKVEEKPKFIPKKLDKSKLEIFMKKEDREEKPKLIPNKLSKNRIEITNQEKKEKPEIIPKKLDIKEIEQKVKEDKILIEKNNLKNIEKEEKINTKTLNAENNLNAKNESNPKNESNIIIKNIPKKINIQERFNKMLDEKNSKNKKEKDTIYEPNNQNKTKNKFSEFVNSINKSEKERKQFEEDKKNIEIQKTKKKDDIKRREEERIKLEEEKKKIAKEQFLIKKEKEKQEENKRIEEKRKKQEELLKKGEEEKQKREEQWRIQQEIWKKEDEERKLKREIEKREREENEEKRRKQREEERKKKEEEKKQKEEEEKEKYRKQWEELEKRCEKRKKEREEEDRRIMEEMENKRKQEEALLKSEVLEKLNKKEEDLTQAELTKLINDLRMKKKLEEYEKIKFQNYDFEGKEGKDIRYTLEQIKEISTDRVINLEVTFTGKIIVINQKKDSDFSTITIYKENTHEVEKSEIIESKVNSFKIHENNIYCALSRRFDNILIMPLDNFGDKIYLNGHSCEVTDLLYISNYLISTDMEGNIKVWEDNKYKKSINDFLKRINTITKINSLIQIAILSFNEELIKFYDLRYTSLQPIATITNIQGSGYKNNMLKLNKNILAVSGSYIYIIDTNSFIIANIINCFYSNVCISNSLSLIGKKGYFFVGQTLTNKLDDELEKGTIGYYEYNFNNPLIPDKNTLIKIASKNHCHELFINSIRSIGKDTFVTGSDDGKIKFWKLKNI